jgi:hypothetical protein
MGDERRKERWHGCGLQFPFIEILFSRRSLVRRKDALDREKGHVPQ